MRENSDFRVTWETHIPGALKQIQPCSAEANDWWEEYVEKAFSTMPGVYVMEGRFADEILEGVDDEGMTIGWGINFDMVQSVREYEKEMEAELAECEGENIVDWGDDFSDSQTELFLNFFRNPSKRKMRERMK